MNTAGNLAGALRAASRTDDRPAPVEVWWFRAGGGRPHDLPSDADLLALVDPAEAARHGQYVDRGAARMFLVGAALVRCVVATRLGVAPAQVAVDRTCQACGGPHGRPRVAVAAGVPARVSASHSGGLVGVAMAQQELGLDVEALDRGVDLTSLGPAFLSGPEAAAIEVAGLDDDPEHLMLWWTRKEAVLKLMGTGLRHEPSTLTLDVRGDAAEVRTPGAHRWQVGLRRLACRTGYVASLATQTPTPAVERDASILLEAAMQGLPYPHPRLSDEPLGEDWTLAPPSRTSRSQ